MYVDFYLSSLLLYLCFHEGYLLLIEFIHKVLFHFFEVTFLSLLDII